MEESMLRLYMVKERDILYRFLHEILPTKKRLKEIYSIPSSKCDNCEHEESNIHFVFQCEKLTDVVIWFKSLLQNFCNLDNPRLINLCFLLTPRLDKKHKNAAIMLMSTFIVSMWQIRQNNMNSDTYKNYIKNKLYQKKVLINYILGNKTENLLPENICYMRRSDL